VFIQGEVRHEPFEPAVFFLHLPEPPQLAHAQVRVLLFPGVEGGVTHPELPTQIADRGASFGLSNCIHGLFL
jgi:hypothetical protein